MKENYRSRNYSWSSSLGPGIQDSFPTVRSAATARPSPRQATKKQEGDALDWRGDGCPRKFPVKLFFSLDSHMEGVIVTIVRRRGYQVRCDEFLTLF